MGAWRYMVQTWALQPKCNVSRHDHIWIPCPLPVKSGQPQISALDRPSRLPARNESESCG